MKLAAKLVILVVLVLIVYGLAFIYFAPGYELFFVRSESMSPNINIGDLVVTGPVNGVITGEVAPGKVVTFQKSKNNMITHRVVEVNGDKLVTKGDAMEEPDPFITELSQVKGIYIFRVPLIGYLTSFIRSKLGWYLLIILPAMGLVSWIIVDIVKESLKRNSYY